MLMIKCSICLEGMWNNIIELECHHMFHFSCFRQLMNAHQKTCPNCRAIAVPSEIALSDAPSVATIIEQVSIDQPPNPFDRLRHKVHF